MTGFLYGVLSTWAKNEYLCQGSKHWWVVSGGIKGFILLCVHHLSRNSVAHLTDLSSIRSCHKYFCNACTMKVIVIQLLITPFHILMSILLTNYHTKTENYQLYEALSLKLFKFQIKNLPLLLLEFLCYFTSLV